MLSIGFVVTPGFPVMSLAALSVFEFANFSAEKPLYDIHVLSEDGGPIPSASGTSLETTAFGDRRFDTLIIGGNTRAVPTSPKLLAFLSSAAKTSRRISSICTGVFALADAALLGNRRVTTHWLFTDDLKARFPKVRLEADRIYIVDGPIWTAAGNSAGIDLAQQMLEADYGSDLARTVTRILVVDQQRSGGQSQHSALLDMNPKSDRIQHALAYARRNLRAALSVGDLANAAGLGPRQFSRAFRNATGASPAEAIASLRLEGGATDDRAKPTSDRSGHARNRIRRSGTDAPGLCACSRPVPTSAEARGGGRTGGARENGGNLNTTACAKRAREGRCRRLIRGHEPATGPFSGRPGG
jgi:transcriptional regulator GlxA family with amidase domain